MIIITNWVGRTGNNLIQLINAVRFAQKNRHHEIRFPPHPLLSGTRLTNCAMHAEGELCEDEVRGDFFSAQKYIGCKVPPTVMRQCFLDKIAPLFVVKRDDALRDKLRNTLVIHMRGGDIFSQRPHGAYVQPPLAYYETIIRNGEFKNILVVSEDQRNPCVRAVLERHKDARFQSGTVEQDLATICNSTHLAMGFGTFGLVAFFAGHAGLTVHMPSNFRETLAEDWGDDVRVRSYAMVGYIPPGKWDASPRQLMAMMSYPPDKVVLDES